MSDPAPSLPLPPVQQAPLDPATLAALFRDLAACTQVLAVTPRRAGPPQRETPLTTISLAQAAAGLQSGEFRGVQIRYRYEGQNWCDTLMARPDGIRLVRISETDIAATLTPGETRP